MLCPPYQPLPLFEDWLSRHRRPVCFVLHVIGIPPTIIAVLILPIVTALMSFPLFLLALSLFLGGYALQFLGHFLEGTEPGELTFLRKKLARRFLSTGARRESQGSTA